MTQPNKDKSLITVVGPTACGKTNFATHLASHLDAEIISADSRQLYRGMDIGTGKDLADYTIDGKNIPYHLIDIRQAGEKYTLFDYQKDFRVALRDIQQRDKRPILCGGTGLYIESVLKGYHLQDVPINHKLREELESKTMDELASILASYQPLHNTTDFDTKKRAIRAIEIAQYQAEHPAKSLDFQPIPSIIIGLNIPRELRRERISRRLEKRLSQENMVGEVERLLQEGIAPEDLLYYGLEYKFLTQHVLGELSFEEMKNQLEIAIHQFAKRQMTWFRGMEKRGFTIHWIDATQSLSSQVEQGLHIVRNNTATLAIENKAQ